MNKIVEISIKVKQKVNEIKIGGKNRQENGKINPGSPNLSKSNFQKQNQREECKKQGGGGGEEEGHYQIQENVPELKSMFPE